MNVFVFALSFLTHSYTFCSLTRRSWMRAVHMHVNIQSKCKIQVFRFDMQTPIMQYALHLLIPLNS